MSSLSAWVQARSATGADSVVSAAVNTADPKTGDTFLHACCRQVRASLFSRALRRLTATSQGALPFVQRLVDLRADINLANKSGRTPLAEAVRGAVLLVDSAERSERSAAAASGGKMEPGRSNTTQSSTLATKKLVGERSRSVRSPALGPRHPHLPGLSSVPRPRARSQGRGGHRARVAAGRALRGGADPRRAQVACEAHAATARAWRPRAVAYCSCARPGHDVLPGEVDELPGGAQPVVRSSPRR